MRIKANNRDKRLKEITEFIERSKFLLYTEDILDSFTAKIFSDKINKGASYIEGTARYKRAMADAREKAIASLTKYYHVNGIKSILGFFYIITSESYPNYYKLGYAKDCEDRLGTYQTYSPKRDFRLVKYIAVANAKLAESIAIEYLGNRMEHEWFMSDDINTDFKNISKEIARRTGVGNRFHII